MRNVPLNPNWNSPIHVANLCAAIVCEFIRHVLYSLKIHNILKYFILFDVELLKLFLFHVYGWILLRGTGPVLIEVAFQKVTFRTISFLESTLNYTTLCEVAIYKGLPRTLNMTIHNKIINKVIMQ